MRSMPKLDKILDGWAEGAATKDERPRARSYGGFAAPGQIMSLSRQVMLKPTDEQKKKLTELQNRVDDKLDQILTINQKTQFKKLKQDFGRVGFSGSLSATKPAAPIASLPPGVNPVFRAIRYSADYPGLAGRDLRPIEKSSGATPC